MNKKVQPLSPFNYNHFIVFSLFSLPTRKKNEGMTFDGDFGHSLSLFSSLLKKEGRRKGELISKNRDQKSCLSARSEKKGREQKEKGQYRR